MSSFWSRCMRKGCVDSQVSPPSHPIRAHQTRTRQDVDIVLNAVADGIMLLLILLDFHQVRTWLQAASTRSSCGFCDPDAANGIIVGSSPSQAASQPIPIPISDRSQRSASAPNIPLLPLSPTRLSAAQIRADMVDSRGRSGAGLGM
jgi:hypothetical protein